MPEFHQGIPEDALLKSWCQAVPFRHPSASEIPASSLGDLERDPQMDALKACGVLRNSLLIEARTLDQLAG